MTRSKLQRAYSNLRKRKAAYCAGKVNKTAVKQAASNYIKAAVAKGQTKADATKKANRVLNSGCKMSSRVSGTKSRKKNTRKKRSTRK